MVILPSMTHFSTSEVSICRAEATSEYGRSRPIFLKPSEASVSSRIFRSNCVLSKSELILADEMLEDFQRAHCIFQELRHDFPPMT